jgi:hypothetical protein
MIMVIDAILFTLTMRDETSYYIYLVGVGERLGRMRKIDRTARRQCRTREIA